MAPSKPELAGQVVGIWGFGREGVSMARTAAAAGAARIEAVDDVGRGRFEVPDDIAGVDRVPRRRAPEPLAPLRHRVHQSRGAVAPTRSSPNCAASGQRISSAADWFVSRHGAQTIGVTGTKGKSTTASFLGHLLGALGVNAVVAGNIGTPLSDLSPAPDAVVVAELSSQQAALLTTSPAVAVVTNLYEDHLDWHGGTDPYYLAKANVFRNGCPVVGVHSRRRRGVAAGRGDVVPAVGAARRSGDGAQAGWHVGDGLRAQRGERRSRRPGRRGDARPTGLRGGGRRRGRDVRGSAAPAADRADHRADQVDRRHAGHHGGERGRRPRGDASRRARRADRRRHGPGSEVRPARRLPVQRRPTGVADPGADQRRHDRARVCPRTPVGLARRRQPGRSGPGSRGAARRSTWCCCHRVRPVTTCS